MTRKKVALISVLVLSLLVILIAFAYATSEARGDKIKRLNSVAKNLPKFDGKVISSETDIDGECNEVSSSSALPALSYRVLLTEENYETVKERFIEQAENQGISWQKENLDSSNVFERNGKDYKLQFIKYTQPPNHYGINLTACD